MTENSFFYSKLCLGVKGFNIRIQRGTNTLRKKSKEKLSHSQIRSQLGGGQETHFLKGGLIT